MLFAPFIKKINILFIFRKLVLRQPADILMNSTHLQSLNALITTVYSLSFFCRLPYIWLKIKAIFSLCKTKSFLRWHHFQLAHHNRHDLQIQAMQILYFHDDFFYHDP